MALLNQPYVAMNNGGTVVSLEHLSDEEFREIVDNSLRKQGDPETAASLREPANVERWYSTLLKMSKSVEGQLAARTADWKRSNLSGAEDLAERRENYLKWRAQIIRFKTGLDEALTEAKYLRDKNRTSQYGTFITDERLALLQRVQKLETTIRQHKEQIFHGDDDDHDKADESLWAIVEDKEKP